MSSNFGEQIKISIFGQSHSEGIGVVIDGLPAGEKIDMDDVYAFMKRRAPGQQPFSTPRKEDDRPHILSGVFSGKTCGTPLCAVIENTNTQSKDYIKLKDMPRPGHADFTAEIKYGGFQDYRGGGHFSGRLTAPLCFAGAICMQILERKGISIGGHIFSIKHEKDIPIDAVSISATDLEKIKKKVFPVFSDEAGNRMQHTIASARMEGDSVGGIIEAAVVGLPIGLGEPIFDGLESKLASILFAIPAVKGVEFGEGFGASLLLGSQHNDTFYYNEKGEVKTKTNRHGGSLGGISSGMPLTIRVALKPTPSISKAQDTISFTKRKAEKLQITGRHDPCIVPRAVPCVEAALAIALLDLYYIRH